jgi:hypothetical protein
MNKRKPKEPTVEQIQNEMVKYKIKKHGLSKYVPVAWKVKE